MPDDPIKALQDKYSKYGVSVGTPTRAETREIPVDTIQESSPKKPTFQEKFGFSPYDAMDTDTQPGYMPGYEPQSEESKKFQEEWNQKGAGAKFRTGVKAGWEEAKGGLKYAASEVAPLLLSGMGSSHLPAEYYRHDPGMVKLRDSAEKNFEAAPEGAGMLYETGRFVPQVAGTMAALVAAPVTGGTSAAAIPMMLGTANSAALGGMVLGRSLYDYDQYVAENGIEPSEVTRWGVSLAAAAAEFAAEKIRVGRLLPDGMIGKVMGDALKANPNMADDMMRKWAKAEPKVFRKFLDFTKKSALQANEEGMEEFATEFVQSYLQNIYKNPEDDALFSEVISNSVQAYKGGAMMGGMLGPGSYVSNNAYHNMRRKRNGVTLVETDQGKVFEYMGPDAKNPNSMTVMDNLGKVSVIKNDVVKDHRTMDYSEMKEYLDVYKQTQKGMPEMEEKFKRNEMRKHVDVHGQKIAYEKDGSKQVVIGQDKEGNAVYIKGSFEDIPGKVRVKVVDVKTLEPRQMDARDLVGETFNMDYETWLDNEVEAALTAQDEMEQGEKDNAQQEKAVMEELGVQEFSEGEKVLYQNRQWFVTETTPDGNLIVEPIGEDNLVDPDEGSMEIPLDELPNVAKYQPEQAPEAPGETTEGEQQQGRTIDDGKNEYNVVNGKIDQTYPTAKQANGIAKKLSEIYTGLAFNVHEHDDGDPFNKNEYTITVDVIPKQTEEAAQEATEEQTQVPTDESAAVEESAVMAPEAASEENKVVEFDQVETSPETASDESLVKPDQVSDIAISDTQEAVKESGQDLKTDEETQGEALNEEPNQSEEDAFAETEGFLPEPVDMRLFEDSELSIFQDRSSESGKSQLDDEFNRQEQAEKESDLERAGEDERRVDSQSGNENRAEKQEEVTPPELQAHEARKDLDTDKGSREIHVKPDQPQFAGEVFSNHDKDIRNTVNTLADNLNTPIVVVNHFSGLPRNIQRSIKDSRIPGAYDISGDKVYIITSETRNAKEAAETVLHEVVGHKGLRGLLGSEFNTVLEDVYRSMNAADKSAISRVYHTNDKYEIADEFLAHMAERDTHQSVLDRAVAWIRRQLRKVFGLDYNNADVIDLLNRSRRKLQEKNKKDPDFVGDLFKSNQQDKATDYSEYLKKASSAVGEKSAIWIKHGIESHTPEYVMEWLHEKEAFYRDSPRINNQIKRAIKFIEKNDMPGVRFKLEMVSLQGPPIDMLQTKGEKFRRMAQDRSLAIRKLQNIVKGKRGKITNTSNPYRQENLSHGIVKASIEDYGRQFIDPLLNTISEIQKATGMDYDQINEYMIAKHAPERNEKLFKKAGQNVNSGMSTEDYVGSDGKRKKGAKSIVRDYEAKMTVKQVEKFWQQINKATHFSLRRAVQDGFIKLDLFNNLTGSNGYKYYVPLRGWSSTEEDSLFDYIQQDTGKIVNPFRAAQGRTTLSDDPLQYIVNMAHTAIVMGEKNRTKQQMSSLIRNNNKLQDKDGKPMFWFKRVYYVWDGTTDENGKKNMTEHLEKPPQELWDEGKVEMHFNSQHMKRRAMSQAKEHEVEVWIGGEKYVMILPSDVANALNRTPSAWDHGAYILQKFPGKITRFLSENFTSKNPAFIPVNQIRDLQYALWAHAIKGSKGDVARFTRALPKARSAIIRSLKGKADMNSKWDRMYRDFRLNGGETGYIHMQNVDQLAKNLKKDLKRLNRKNAAGKTLTNVYLGAGEMLEHWAIRSENLSRFATYVAAIERGATPKQAAQEAKDITVNFNRKGMSAGVTGSFYAFFNAGIQGGHNALKMAKDNPGKMTAASIGMMSLGFVTAMLSHMWAGDDDDDTMNDYEELNDYHKYNNLTIPVPGKDRFVTIPLPHFFRAFNAAGVLAYQSIVTKEKTTGEAISDGLSAAATALSPVNPVELFEQGKGPVGFLRPFTPTAMVPLLDIATNTDFAGNAIRREPFTSSMEGRIANSQLGKGHVNKGIKWFTDQMFTLGGGDPEVGSKFYRDDAGNIKRVNDFLDINPSNIEHLFEYCLGGRGRFWNNVLKTGEGIYQGATVAIQDGDFREAIAEVNPNTIPIFRRMYNQPWQNSVYTRYYDILNELEDYKSLVRGEAGLNDQVAVDDLMDPYHDFVNEELKYLKEDLKYIDEDIDLFNDEETTMLLNDQKELLIRNFLEVEKIYREMQ